MKSSQVTTASSTAFETKGQRKLLSKVSGYFSKLLRDKNTYIELISALLIILFIYTGVNKLIDHSKFLTEMGRSPFLEQFAKPISFAIPGIELLISILLAIPKTRTLGLYLSYTLMLLFTGYIWLMLNYAYDLPCSCGGIISKMSWNQHFYFNLLFTTITLIAIILQYKNKFALSIQKS